MSSLFALQHQFAAAVKDQTAAVPEGIASERLAVYRELVINNVANFVSSTFPVLRQLCQPQVFEQKISAFFQQTQLDSPYFIEIPAAFLQWLSDHCDDLPPFALELAHYEWLELDLFRRETVELSATAGQTLSADAVATLILAGGRLQMSPLLEVAAYQFPVHQLSVAYQPMTAPEQPTFLALYRGQDDQVHFMQLDALSTATIQLLQEAELSLTDLVDTLSTLAPGLNRDDIAAGALKLLQQLHQAGLVRLREGSC